MVKNDRPVKNRILKLNSEVSYGCPISNTRHLGKYNGWAIVKLGDSQIAIDSISVAIEIRPFGLFLPEKSDMHYNGFNLGDWLVSGLIEALLRPEYLSVLKAMKIIEISRKLNFEILEKIEPGAWHNFFFRSINRDWTWNLTNVKYLNCIYDLARMVGVKTEIKTDAGKFQTWAKTQIEYLLNFDNGQNFEDVNSIIMLAANLRTKLLISGNARQKFSKIAIRELKKIAKYHRRVAKAQFGRLLSMSEIIGAKLDIRPVLDWIFIQLREKAESEYGLRLFKVGFTNIKQPNLFALKMLKKI